MKNLGPLIVLGFLLLAGIGLFLLLGPFAEKPGMRAVYENKTSQAGTSQGPSPAVPRTPAGQPGAAEVEARVPEAAAQPPTAKSGEAPTKFPTAADVANGMERPRLLSLFGPPNMRTVSVEQGAQLETLVYLRRDPDAATFILLRAGRVVSATTTSY